MSSHLAASDPETEGVDKSVEAFLGDGPFQQMDVR